MTNATMIPIFISLILMLVCILGGIFSTGFIIAYFSCSLDDDRDIQLESWCQVSNSWYNFVYRSTALLDYLPNYMAIGFRFPLAYVSFCVWLLYYLINILLQTFISLALIDYIMYTINALLLLIGLTISFSPWILAGYKTFHKMLPSIDVYEFIFIVTFWFSNLFIFILFGLIMHDMQVEDEIIVSGKVMDKIPYWSQFYYVISQYVYSTYLPSLFTGLRMGLYYGYIYIILICTMSYLMLYYIVIVAQLLLGFVLALGVLVGLYYLFRDMQALMQ